MKNLLFLKNFRFKLPSHICHLHSDDPLSFFQLGLSEKLALPGSFTATKDVFYHLSELVKPPSPPPILIWSFTYNFSSEWLAICGVSSILTFVALHILVKELKTSRACSD